MVKRILVSTDLAVLFLVREGATEAQARQSIKWWVRSGKIRNFGGSTRGKALYDLHQIKPLAARWWPDPPP